MLVNADETRNTEGATSVCGVCHPEREGASVGGRVLKRQN